MFPIYPDPAGEVIREGRIPTLDDCNLSLLPTNPFALAHIQLIHLIHWTSPVAVSAAYSYGGVIYQCFLGGCVFQADAWGDDIITNWEEDGIIQTSPRFECTPTYPDDWNGYSVIDAGLTENLEQAEKEIWCPANTTLTFQSPLFEIPDTLWYAINHSLTDDKIYSCFVAWDRYASINILYRKGVPKGSGVGIMPFLALGKLLFDEE